MRFNSRQLRDAKAKAVQGERTAHHGAARRARLGGYGFGLLTMFVVAYVWPGTVQRGGDWVRDAVVYPAVEHAQKLSAR